MDIICKCGHAVEQHLKYYGCCHTDYEKSSTGGTICNCALSPSEVYEIYITEQQARLDICREKIEVLIKERDNLQRVLFPIVVECPFSFDDATIPRGGIDKAPEQVVVNMSIGWMRIVKAREALGLKVGIP